jgi:Bacterial archaeo-eukaryotic release factor family 3
LVLAAVDYLQPIYRQANTYAHLLEEGVKGNPDHLSNNELHDRAWPIVEFLFQEAKERADAQYRQMAGTDYVSGDLEAVVTAAHQGRVETLFVALDRQVWGVFDPAAGRVERHEQALYGDADLLNMAVAQTLAHGRTVFAVEPRQVPSGTDVAAIFCHPLPSHGKKRS